MLFCTLQTIPVWVIYGSDAETGGIVTHFMGAKIWVISTLIQQKQPFHNFYAVKTAVFLVGVSGFEPEASWTRTKRDTKLRHTPLAKLL